MTDRILENGMSTEKIVDKVTIKYLLFLVCTVAQVRMSMPHESTVKLLYR